MLRPCSAEEHYKSNYWNIVTSFVAIISPYLLRALTKILTELSSKIIGREDLIKL